MQAADMSDLSSVPSTSAGPAATKPESVYPSPSLLCPLCGLLFTQAVMTPCCAKTVCKPCAVDRLVRSKTCWFGDCEMKVRIDERAEAGLIVDHRARSQVDEFLGENPRYASTRREVMESGIKTEPAAGGIGIGKFDDDSGDDDGDVDLAECFKTIDDKVALEKKLQREKELSLASAFDNPTPGCSWEKQPDCKLLPVKKEEPEEVIVLSGDSSEEAKVPAKQLNDLQDQISELASNVKEIERKARRAERKRKKKEKRKKREQEQAEKIEALQRELNEMKKQQESPNSLAQGLIRALRDSSTSSSPDTEVEEKSGGRRRPTPPLPRGRCSRSAQSLPRERNRGRDVSSDRNGPRQRQSYRRSGTVSSGRSRSKTPTRLRGRSPRRRIERTPSRSRSRSVDRRHRRGRHRSDRNLNSRSRSPSRRRRKSPDWHWSPSPSPPPSKRQIRQSCEQPNCPPESRVAVQGECWETGICSFPVDVECKKCPKYDLVVSKIQAVSAGKYTVEAVVKDVPKEKCEKTNVYIKAYPSEEGNFVRGIYRLWKFGDTSFESYKEPPLSAGDVVGTCFVMTPKRKVEDSAPCCRWSFADDDEVKPDADDEKEFSRNIAFLEPNHLRPIDPIVFVPDGDGSLLVTSRDLRLPGKARDPINVWFSSSGSDLPIPSTGTTYHAMDKRLFGIKSSLLVRQLGLPPLTALGSNGNKPTSKAKGNTRNVKLSGQAKSTTTSAKDSGAKKTTTLTKISSATTKRRADTPEPKTSKLGAKKKDGKKKETQKSNPTDASIASRESREPAKKSKFSPAVNPVSSASTDISDEAPVPRLKIKFSIGLKDTSKMPTSDVNSSPTSKQKVQAPSSDKDSQKEAPVKAKSSGSEASQATATTPTKSVGSAKASSSATPAFSETVTPTSGPLILDSRIEIAHMASGRKSGPYQLKLASIPETAKHAKLKLEPQQRGRFIVPSVVSVQRNGTCMASYDPGTDLNALPPRTGDRVGSWTAATEADRPMPADCSCDVHEFKSVVKVSMTPWKNYKLLVRCEDECACFAYAHGCTMGSAKPGLGIVYGAAKEVLERMLRVAVAVGPVAGADRNRLVVEKGEVVIRARCAQKVVPLL